MQQNDANTGQKVAAQQLKVVPEIASTNTVFEAPEYRFKFAEIPGISNCWPEGISSKDLIETAESSSENGDISNWLTDLL